MPLSRRATLRRTSMLATLDWGRRSPLRRHQTLSTSSALGRYSLTQRMSSPRGLRTSELVHGDDQVVQQLLRLVLRQRVLQGTQDHWVLGTRNAAAPAAMPRACV